MQQVAKRAAKPAIAAAAAAAGSIVNRDEAQCDPARLGTTLICPSDIHIAGAMVKESLVLSRSQDGTEWLDVPSVQLPDLDAFVSLAIEVAEDPSVQRVIADKVASAPAMASASASALTHSLGSSGELVEVPSDVDDSGGEAQAAPGGTALKPTGPADPPQTWGEDDELVRSLVGDPSLIASSLSSTFTSDPSHNTQDELELENVRLRRENDALRSALAVKEAMEKAPSDETAETKSCPSLPGKDEEEGFWPCASCTFRNSPLLPFCEICEAQRSPYEEPSQVAQAVAGPPPRVLTAITVDADCRVRLSLRLQERLPPWASKPGVGSMPKQRPTLDEDGPGCVAGQTALLAAAIIVGIVALLITRNPKGAKAAAASAAAMVAGLFAKSRVSAE